MRKEIGNGDANQRLASGGWWVVLTSAEAKEMAKGENLWPMSPFIGEGERERGASVVPNIGVRWLMACRSSGNTALHPLPCSRSGLHAAQSV
jgi:hypothetical protein